MLKNLFPEELEQNRRRMKQLGLTDFKPDLRKEPVL